MHYLYIPNTRVLNVCGFGFIQVVTKHIISVVQSWLFHTTSTECNGKILHKEIARISTSKDTADLANVSILN